VALARWNLDIAGGLVLIALAVFAFVSTRSLEMGVLARMGPGMLPQILAALLGLCGVLLLGFGIARRDGEASSGGPRRALGGVLRGPVMMTLAIFAFALSLRPVDLGFVTTPGLGLLIAGPLAVIICGFASPEARFRELVLLSLLLTPFCIALFGDMLNLPIPLYPESLRALFPQDWSNRAIMRSVTLTLIVLGLALLAPSLLKLRAARNV
jgi:Tripartite tricarboxylate transporter TctB family